MVLPVDVVRKLREDPEREARVAARDIALATTLKRHDVAIVFGTGWDPAVKQLGSPRSEFPAASINGFLPPVVEGHAGLIRSVRIGRKNVLVFRGRHHLYQFLDDETGMPVIMHYVRVAQAAGCRAFVHTNAVGGLQPNLCVGQLVVVSDHNDVITSVPSPLRGAPSFLDCSKVYDHPLRRLCRRIDPKLVEGVIANVRGPHFESPAAARFLRENGCDIVGMTMIPEAILSHFLGMPFLGLSLVTDAAGESVTHTAVQKVVKRRAPALGRFLRQLVEKM